MTHPIGFGVEVASVRLKRHKASGIDWIPAEMIKAGVGGFLPRSINLLILFRIRRNCLRSGRSRSFYLFYKKGDKTNCSYYRGISLLPTTYKILSNVLISKLTPYAEKITGNDQFWFRSKRSNTDHTIYRIYFIRQVLEKKMGIQRSSASASLIFKEVDDSDRWVSYIIFSLSWYPYETGKDNKVCLNETYSRVRVCKYLSDVFPIKHGSKPGDALSPLLFKCALTL